MADLSAEPEFPLLDFFAIHVTTMTGETVRLMVFPTDRVIEVKMALFAKLGLPPGQQSLVFEGEELGRKQL